MNWRVVSPVIFAAETQPLSTSNSSQYSVLSIRDYCCAGATPR